MASWACCARHSMPAGCHDPRSRPDRSITLPLLIRSMPRLAAKQEEQAGRCTSRPLLSHLRAAAAQQHQARTASAMRRGAARAGALSIGEQQLAGRAVAIARQRRQAAMLRQLAVGALPAAAVASRCCRPHNGRRHYRHPSGGGRCCQLPIAFCQLPFTSCPVESSNQPNTFAASH